MNRIPVPVWLGCWVLLAFCLTPSPCQATKYPPAERRDILFPNGRYVLDADPRSGLHAVYASADRTKPLWSFSDKHLFESPRFLANDGQCVAVLAWRFVPTEAIDDGER